MDVGTEAEEVVAGPHEDEVGFAKAVGGAFGSQGSGGGLLELEDVCFGVADDGGGC